MLATFFSWFWSQYYSWSGWIEGCFKPLLQEFMIIINLVIDTTLNLYSNSVDLFSKSLIPSHFYFSFFFFFFANYPRISYLNSTFKTFPLPPLPGYFQQWLYFLLFDCCLYLWDCDHNCLPFPEVLPIVLDLLSSFLCSVLLLYKSQVIIITSYLEKFH